MPPKPLDSLLPRPADRQRVQSLLSRGWWPPRRPQHPLGRLQGRPLGAAKLLLMLGPKNNVGAIYFRLYLVDAQGRLSRQPLAEGLHNSGRFPAYNWLELIRYDPQPQFDGQRLNLAAQGLERRLFRLLGSLLPPGGHLMVEYESPGQRATERLLGLGYHPAASPLGALLLAAGCLSFRDWYIPEGGREGPRKLQGFKPLDAGQAREKAAALAEALRQALQPPLKQEEWEWGPMARRLAGAALRALGRRLDSL